MCFSDRVGGNSELSLLLRGKKAQPGAGEDGALRKVQV